MHRSVKVSIIVPVYNMENTVKTCLDSILTQDYNDIEVIVINDGSTDKSSEICENYAMNDERIVYISRENKGLALTYKEGIELAVGDFILFVDSDDFIEKEMVGSLVQMQEKANADIVQSGIIYLRTNGELIRKFCVPDRTIKEQNVLIEDYFLTGKLNKTFAGNLFRRELFDGIEFPEGALSIDLQVIPFVLVKSKVFVQVEKEFYNAVMFKESVSRGQVSDRMYEDKKKCMATWNRFFDTYAPQYRDYMFYILTLVSVTLCSKMMLEHCSLTHHEHKLEECKKFFKTNYALLRCSEIYEKIGKKDKLKLFLFKISPKLYCRVLEIYEKKVIENN